MTRVTRRHLIPVLAAAIAVVLGAGTAFAFWSATSTGSGNASADNLAAPIQTAPTNVTSTGAQVNWTAITTGWQKDATYTATVSGGGGQTCNAAASVGNCSLTGLVVGTTYTVTLTATFSSWTSAASNTQSVTALSTGPAAPTSVQLANGGGQGSAFVNNAIKSSVSFAVALPTTSLLTDTVHLTIGDGVPAHLLTAATKAGTVGAGTVNFTALNLSALNDGALAVTAWVTNVSGTSTNATASPVKDVLAPSATLSVVAPVADHTTFAAGFVGSSLHFRPCTGNFGLTIVATETDATSGPQSATFPAVTNGNGWTARAADQHSTPAGGPFTSNDYLYSANNCSNGGIAGLPNGGPFSVSTSDAAGNTGSVSFTFLADSTAPTVTNVTLNDGGQAGSAVGRIDAGDFAEVTYGEAMDASSFCSTWVNDGTTQTASGTVSVGGSGADVLTISAATGCAFGQINLNRDYNTASTAMSFTSSTITLDPSTNKLRIVLGTRSGGTVNSTLQSAFAPAYRTVSSGVETDLVGNAIASNASTTGTSSRF
jgi:hypothetical protein